ncbi:ribonuclease III domain-containing protein [Pseudothermotoga sp.]|uniref:ribonuclease III domain-containing protein n=1 Tax=Pseudothermotoga sp. TaxID=2033661 RepID=UPI0031FC2531
MGDAIHSFFAKVASLNHLSVGRIHKKVAGLISREFQARRLEQLVPRLSEEELSVVKRAMNSKCAKRYGNDENYRKSTALEALIGYLYLAGDRDRLLEILNFSLMEYNDDCLR